MPTPLSLAALDQLDAAVATPGYARSELTPGILHIGVGNFHRAHQQLYLDRLFNLGLDHDWGLIGAGVRPTDAAMRDRLARQDWLTTIVELDPEGLSARVIGPMMDFLEVDGAKLVEALADPAIRIVSLTITEGGYYIDAMTGGFDGTHADIMGDVATPEAPKTVFGLLIAGLKARRAAGHPPFTVMTCDNLPENGHVARQAVEGLAALIDPDFAAWIGANVAFPNSMVDCITPATSDRERALVKERFGIEDAAPVVCEPFHQWVMEDNFPLGRPALEKVGVEFVEDVAPYELMKLRILNGGHAAIAYPSALLGHHFVHDAMADPDIRAWLVKLQKSEAIPTLVPIEGVDYEAYLDLIVSRFANPEVGDTIPRLCLDGSNRQPKFILPTVRQALKEGRSVDGLALEVAFWCRYCVAEDEAGRAISVDDEAAAELKERALAARSNPTAFLEYSRVFGDLAREAAFHDCFAAHLTDIWSRGVRAVLADYLRD